MLFGQSSYEPKKHSVNHSNARLQECRNFDKY